MSDRWFYHKRPTAVDAISTWKRTGLSANVNAPVGRARVERGASRRAQAEVADDDTGRDQFVVKSQNVNSSDNILLHKTASLIAQPKFSLKFASPMKFKVKSVRKRCLQACLFLMSIDSRV